MADVLASAADEDRRVTPIVWGTTDPIFREALASNLLGNVPDAPTKTQVFEIAVKLHAEYVAIVSGGLKANGATGKISLYRGEREIYHDNTSIGINRSGRLDESSSLKSIARTWLDKLSQGAFKKLVPAPRIKAPEMAPALVAPVEAVAVPAVDNTALVNSARALRAATAREIDRIQRTQSREVDVAPIVDDLKRAGEQAVIALFRDAVDAEPLDIARRKLLFEAILPLDPKLAASEARRAAQVMPEAVELRVMSAQAWLKLKDQAQAQADLNEAVARDPSSVAVRLALTEIALGKLDFITALEHIDKAVKQSDNSVTRRMRALVRAMLGGNDGVKSDIAACKEPVSVDQSATYLRALDVALDDSISSMKSLMQRVAVRPKDEAVKEGLDTATRTLTSRISFMEGTTTPVSSRDISERLLLAHKLLQQCVVDLRDFAANAADDSLSDARINLNESVRMLSESRSRSSS